MDNSFNRSRQPKGVPAGGEFASTPHAESSLKLQIPTAPAPQGLDGLAAATPTVIDTELAELYYQQAKAAAWTSGFESTIARYEKRGGSAPGHLYESLAEAARAEAEVQATIKPFEAEYTRRGGWTRFFMVMNNGGHLHSSRSCSTCRPSTQFGWMPAYSGQDEAGVVGLAGEDSCTVCFPSAPVDQKSMLPFRVAEREEAAEAAAEKETRAVKAASERVVVGRKVYKTVRGAENEVGWQVECMISSRYHQAADAAHRAGLDANAAKYYAEAREIGEAIAVTVPGYDVDALLTKKFETKAKMLRKSGFPMPEDAALEGPVV
ncbi:hypothetical protein IV500_06490 [Paeniglutamicibacter antarcticus]|uniref:Uncharacterized protein n=1 Tax=Arthrobacter terrae TaxID=2935737 RepID=A0A931G4P8_9MICC|nr:hypothetical protein [Arthrobacter terrae]MBG0739048.1 hypothetical protein [Arthrobacter terrae]